MELEWLDAGPKEIFWKNIKFIRHLLANVFPPNPVNISILINMLICIKC